MRKAGISLDAVQTYVGPPDASIEYEDILDEIVLDGLTVFAAVDPEPEPHRWYDTSKRCFDVVGALLGLLLLSPVFLVIGITLAVSGGPIFFRQQRLGLCGKEFSCWKFRSMVPEAEELLATLVHLNLTKGPTFKAENDPRVTRIGRWLRRTSLDELPQLWNVLIGDMSLVGPRPLAVNENPYREDWRRRLGVKPGLTCIWQVSGRSRIGFEQWMQLDVQYVQTRTLVGDIMLTLKTLPAVLTGRGAI